MPINDDACQAKLSHGWTQMNTDRTAITQIFSSLFPQELELSDRPRLSVFICVHLWLPAVPEVTP